MSFDDTLPLIFMAVMGLAMLAYVVLDGFDLGVGMLLHRATPQQQDVMVSSIGPFWDANETWLVLGVGILLIAFPKAHGIVLTALYLPVAVMLIGLILRGVAFDFRVKAHDEHKPLWNRAFFVGSLMASLAQGWMLGRYITGFAEGWAYTVFAAAIALALAAAYVLLGATWLVMKTEGPLQARAAGWARLAWLPVVMGMMLISLATPIVSETVRARWFTMPVFIALLPIPLVTAAGLITLRVLLNSPRILGRLCWVPFALVVAVFVLGFFGLAYSLYPYVVMDRLTIWEAASAPASLKVILLGTVVTVPAIIGYTVFAYRVFWGKTRELSYA
ncbi:cytochrome d ubiquinol oxidase subunit II [Tepidimonas taiwanensis]|uniref:Cytochrome bd-II ubiquinol oxidase subunit 2 n=1 Tax=Tepidimonas taiwanensis TaxID=307486 RepID=A0A554X5I6_9BURK|nr:cytochrome d ubiquinol oxidase subunit II [Tepidimonas taiwanensis]MCX7693878.1 cytochrome d ubiquinol oxidase subunit II [Tepidimonas taiwanensis]MDM7463872.1 cytochrome d ubiquinol oxidase subunit II [Tepidimonas taiwanensis]TSE31102.1 Cytochrome bd-II ubiquinol oxidase subunit 2 [Tepidimonas taiwanensis]UBQ05241.1 cytochrome d ubiquinol oxidase subunit II [Tepidimonas taiwanensis]